MPTLPPRYQFRRMGEDGATPLLSNRKTSFINESLGHSIQMQRRRVPVSLHTTGDKENKINIIASNKFHERQGMFNRNYRYSGLNENDGGDEEDDYDYFLRQNCSYKKKAHKEELEGSVSMASISEWTYGSALRNKGEVFSHYNPSILMADDDGTMSAFDDISAIYSYDIGSAANDASAIYSHDIGCIATSEALISTSSNSTTTDDSFDPSTIYSDGCASENQDRQHNHRLGGSQEALPPQLPCGVTHLPRPDDDDDARKKPVIDDDRLPSDMASASAPDSNATTTTNSRIVIIDIDKALLADSPPLGAHADPTTDRVAHRLGKNMKSVLGVLGCFGRAAKPPPWVTPLLWLQKHRRSKRDCEI